MLLDWFNIAIFLIPLLLSKKFCYQYCKKIADEGRQSSKVWILQLDCLHCSCFDKWLIIVCTHPHTHTPPPFCWRRRGVEPLTKQRAGGDLTKSQYLEGGCRERGGDFFQRGVQFYVKNKLKSEIVNDKNVFLYHN